MNAYIYLQLLCVLRSTLLLLLLWPPELLKLHTGLGKITQKCAGSVML